MTTVTRKFTFDAGHRVLGHSGKCRHLHGHTYTAEVTVQADTLDSLGMVVDFGVIKEKVGEWIDENWDHNLILNRTDPLLRLMTDVKIGPASLANFVKFVKDEVLAARWPYVLPALLNPTAEVLAKLLCEQAQYLLPDFVVTHVRMWETPNCYADYSRNS
jgi:6-pyruvoyltetrahydropterin/6-carboxytetrahydropterin synthase